MARIYNPVYFDTATFFRDLRTLIDRGELNEIYNIWVPGPSPTGFLAVLQLAAYFDPADPPDDAWLLRGLSMPPEAVPRRDSTYLDWILSVDVLVDSFRTAFQWDRLIKPWFDVWLPEETVEPYVTGVLPTLDPARDVGPMGFMLLLPLRRSTLSRPLLRVPDRPANDWIYLFDILTVSAAPGPDPAFVAEMLNRNRRLFEEARAAGGTRYPIGALEVTRDDWARHYGPVWQQLAKWKQRFDPDNILAPGSGILSETTPADPALTPRRRGAARANTRSVSRCVPAGDVAREHHPSGGRTRRAGVAGDARAAPRSRSVPYRGATATSEARR